MLQPNRFFPEILTTLFDRKGAASGADDARDIYALCHALISEEGNVSGHMLAEIVLRRYSALSEDEKTAFFLFMANDLDIDAKALSNWAADYAKSQSIQDFKRVARAAEPKRQELLRRLNQPLGATQALVSMRVDLLHRIADSPVLARVDLDFVDLLRTWFNRGFLVLKQIDWDAPASLLDKIIAYEAVHEIDDLDDLRRRLSPPDRRCFAFFHPAMPDEPLIFVEVALTGEIPNSIDALLTDGREAIETADARTAVFYSISNCQRGLTGISFGNLLIKQVVQELTLEFPQLSEFVTLSPIPGLRRWIAREAQDQAFEQTAERLLDGTAEPQEIRAVAARYLALAKNAKGIPIDPVARFHLGNGAEIHAIHADADTSRNGMNRSCGAMVNYRYDISVVEKNHREFALNSVVAVSKAVQALAKAPLHAASAKET